VLRLFTTETMPVDARVRFNTALLGKLRSAETVDITERPAGGKGVKKPAVSSSSVEVRIPAAGMVSLRVTFLR
jgi:hypothetical protein